jgi:chemotaxis protein methyltransferase CheR
VSTIQAIHALVEQRLGLATTPNRRADFEDLLRELSGGDMEALIAQLRASDSTAPIWQAMVKALAIGETYFFRDRNHFTLLRESILPALIAQRRASGDLALNITCMGCATGEEPYSIAMLLTEMLPDRPNWLVRIVGLDINGQALEMARRGWYRQWSFRMTDESIYTHFERIENGYQLKPYIRQMVEFRLANLLDGLPVPQFDLILCRNVLLYFTPQRAADAEA